MLTASTGVMQLLSLWIIFLLSTGVSTRKQRSFTDDDGNDDDDDDEAGTWSESVSRARCASRCVSLHGVGAAALLSPPQNNGSLGWCHHHKQCSKCLEPCSDSWKMKKKSNCREMCERVFPKKHWECVTSCEFIQSVLAVKQGSCPPPDRASGFAAACVESCDHDRECSTQKKCCFNNCGHTCQSPKDLYKGAPLKPRKELSFEELSSGELVVHWSSRFNISAEPVVYILQRRWNFGIQPSEDTATSWQLVGQTTEQEVKLSDIRPGRWYQFRVAAVNIHGTRGFTTPSRHIHSSRAVSPASSALLASGVKSSFDKSFKMSLAAPTDVRVTNMSFGPGRTVSAKITWRVPEDLDVPVHHYHVTWSWTAIGQASASAASKRRKTVRERQVVLDSMRSNRRYSVEVQAVSFWGQTQLRGPRAALHFSTQRTAGRVPVSGNLDVGTPFYHEGQLRAHVYWQSSKDPSVEFYKVQWVPEHCGQNQTTHMKTIATRENFISLQGLLFSCKYKILWQPISKKSRPLAESISLLTPPCATIQAKSPKPITCPGETAVSPQKLPVKATNLTALFRVHGSNVSAIFSWGSSMTPPQQALIGYQVTWVELVQTNRRNSKKLPHSLISQSQILPPNGNVLVVSGLHPASVYRLEVKAITAEGEGPATRRTFQTPGYKITPKQRLKLRKHHHDNPVPEKN